MMTLFEIVTAGGISVAVVMSLIQVSPLKIDPWKAVGEMVFGGVYSRITSLDTKMTKLNDRMSKLEGDLDEQKAVACRTRIIRFGDEILHGTYHSKDHFDQILLDVDTYEGYCHSHPAFKNSVTVMTVDRIKRVYQDCLEADSFLK